ncbi:MAG: tRNA 2-thiouridine(34) synthase MnmA [Atribacterota bacterium]
MKQNINVLVAMSGGIDSSVAAFLLKKLGYQVHGIYFQLINDKNYKGKKNLGQEAHGSYSGSQRVQEIAEKLNIPFRIIDYRKEFKETIIDDFISKYQNGITPNPCIICNEKVKFNLLFEYAKNNDMQLISTGHYVQTEKSVNGDEYLLRRGLDIKKDQSYFLYRLNQKILSRSIFPLGKQTKRNTEKIAREIGLIPFRIKESQEICFIYGNNYRQLIETKQGKGTKSGYFLDTSGNILGKHKGIAFYTIGQRRKIGLSLNTRKYIVRLNFKDNTIIIGDEEDLYQKECKLEKVHYISPKPISQPTRLQVQIRYNSFPSSATVIPDREDELRVFFDEPQRAITPGQSAVLYTDDFVVGGGIISNF